jgi:cullin-4
MTRSFYLAESAEQAEALKNNPKEFFRRGKERIGEEINRSKAILPVTSWNLIREITEKAFWGGRMEWLSEKSTVYVYLTNGNLPIAQIIVALADFMADKDFAALASMYTLFARVAVTKSLCDAFRNHIRVCTSSFIMTDYSYILIS